MNLHNILYDERTPLPFLMVSEEGSKTVSRPSERIMKYRRLKPYSSAEIKVLLLENIHPVAVSLFRTAGFQVEVCPKALPREELKEKLKTVHALGIRSKTNIDAELINEMPCLLTIGCFCIGTNQVALADAAARGISVFNSPFSNSRSVAELAIGYIISLSRCIGDRNMEMHKSLWNKTAKDCHEIRGKVLGIIGYGHIGSQLSVLAEALGMNVIYHDIVQVMPHGLAKNSCTLDNLLENSDFVSIHVPETETTINFITSHEIEKMKEGSFLINASRGSIVEIEAVKNALNSGKLRGFAADVFPVEPEKNGQFSTGLEDLTNVIITPHIGGSTEEAQEAIGLEVAHNMINFVNQGTSLGSVNFPQIDLRLSSSTEEYCCRVLNIHKNVPGVLCKINEILRPFNIQKQICEARGSNGYVMTDVAASSISDFNHIFEQIYNLPESIATRIVY